MEEDLRSTDGAVVHKQVRKHDSFTHVNGRRFSNQNDTIMLTKKRFCQQFGAFIQQQIKFFDLKCEIYIDGVS